MKNLTKKEQQDLFDTLRKIRNELRDGNYQGNHTKGMVDLATAALNRAEKIK